MKSHWLFLAAVCFGFALWDLLSGTAWLGRFIRLSRTDQPQGFWSVITLKVVIGFSSLCIYVTDAFAGP